MKPIRKRLTYANVMSSIAVFLLLGGATAFAANQIAKKSVGTKQLKSNSITAAKIKKNAVTTAKIKKGAVSNAKLADGAVNFAKLATGTSVIASATGGPVAADQTGPVNVPLNPPLVLTPVAGQPITLNIEARASLTQKAASTCVVIPLPVVNGFPLLAGQLLELVSPDIPPESIFPNGIPQSDITLPVGLTQPGKPVTVTVEMIGDKANCKAGSTLDQVAIVAMQAK